MMAHFRESALAVAEAREQAAIKQEAISNIRWNMCPFFEGNDLPDRYWRKCPNVLLLPLNRRSLPLAGRLLSDTSG